MSAAELTDVAEEEVAPGTEPLLDIAMRDAEIVLDYCVRAGGLTVDPMVAKTIVAARRGELKTTEEITSFWSAFSAITTTARPATIDGVRHNALPASATGKVSRYQIWAWIALAMLILFQVDWLIGSKLLADIESLDKTTKELPAKKAELARAAGQNAASDPNIAAIEAQEEETQNKLAARVRLLKRWNAYNVFARLFSVGDDQLAEEQAAGFQVTVLQLYVLPLLYGWLGASIFILRNVSRQITERSFSIAAHRIYQLREAMGALAGLAVAWVVSGTADGTTSNPGALSPVALAFVAGYSVDILFTAIDKIVATFSGVK